MSQVPRPRGRPRISKLESTSDSPVNQPVLEDPICEALYPKLIITEQPAPDTQRFRYKSEDAVCTIPGISSTSEHRTYPTIKLEGYQGNALIRVSCVTKDKPYRTHPNNLVGKEGCSNGICTMQIDPHSMTLQFSNLGVECTKQEQVIESLKEKEKMNIDPFRQGFSHIKNRKAIQTKVIRFCFQAFQYNPQAKCTVPLTLPVVSEPVYNKTAIYSTPNIVKLSSCVSYVDGGDSDIILLCDKVDKEDIQVWFYEENENSQKVWEASANITPQQVHRQSAISFQTPKYKNVEVTESVDCFIQLRRPSDGASSIPLKFVFLPLSVPSFLGKNKRPKIKNPNNFLRELQDQIGFPNIKEVFTENSVNIKSSACGLFNNFREVKSTIPHQAVNLLDSFEQEMSLTSNLEVNNVASQQIPVAELINLDFASTSQNSTGATLFQEPYFLNSHYPYLQNIESKPEVFHHSEPVLYNVSQYQNENNITIGLANHLTYDDNSSHFDSKNTKNSLVSKNISEIVNNLDIMAQSPQIEPNNLNKKIGSTTQQLHINNILEMIPNNSINLSNSDELCANRVDSDTLKELMPTDFPSEIENVSLELDCERMMTDSR